MRLNINSARKGNSDYTFNPLSLVSLDFGRLQPINAWSMLLGDKFSSVQGKGLLRCTPQIFPPFGRMNLKSAAFFVPDSQIFSWSSAFHSDNKLWRGQIADSAPSFKNTDFNYGFLNQFSYLGYLSTLVSSSPTTEPARHTFDFTYPTPDNSRSAGHTNLDYYKLTPLGWKIYCVFKSLGYDFVTFPVDTDASSRSAHISANSTYISALNFLCYAKIWNDYFCNSYQSDRNAVSDYLQKIYLNKDIVVAGSYWYSSSNFHMDILLILDILSHMELPYESNLYTNAWNNPNDPTGLENIDINQVNQQSLISPFGHADYGEFGSLDVGPYGNDHSTTVTNIPPNKVIFSQLGHKTLEAFDKFVRRRNLVGSKAVQQLYALFGVEPDEWKKDYVVKLCENSSRVNFSAITSQSDTVNGANGKPLGAFAGVGLGGYDINFSYDSSTYGTVICLAWLNIDPIIMHGLSPDVLRVKPLDFYNPDYDGKAYRPIPHCEITGGKSISQNGYNATSVFGYTNMYDDYRNMRDVVAGAFLDNTTKNFAFLRDLTETRDIMANSSTPMYPQTTDVQYWHLDGNSDVTNPFLTDSSVGDRFWFCVDWNIKCTRPILSSENSFDLEGEGNVTIKKNGDGLA